MGNENGTPTYDYSMLLDFNRLPKDQSDFYDSLDDAQRAKLGDIQDIIKDFADNLSKDQKDQS